MTAYYSLIGAGSNNIVSGSQAFLGAGSTNTVKADLAFIGSGTGNIINAGGTDSSIVAGVHNAISGKDASVLGGAKNVANGAYAIVAGGEENFAGGALSFAGGYHADALHTGSFVWSDYTSGSSALKDAAANQFVVRASGGTFVYSNEAASSGVMLASGSGTWSSLSDRNAKTDVRPLDDASILAKVTSLPVSTWQYRSERGCATWARWRRTSTPHSAWVRTTGTSPQSTRTASLWRRSKRCRGKSVPCAKRTKPSRRSRREPATYAIFEPNSAPCRVKSTLFANEMPHSKRASTRRDGRSGRDNIIAAARPGPRPRATAKLVAIVSAASCHRSSSATSSCRRCERPVQRSGHRPAT